MLAIREKTTTILRILGILISSMISLSAWALEDFGITDCGFVHQEDGQVHNRNFSWNPGYVNASSVAVGAVIPGTEYSVRLYVLCGINTSGNIGSMIAWVNSFNLSVPRVELPAGVDYQVKMSISEGPGIDAANYTFYPRPLVFDKDKTSAIATVSFPRNGLGFAVIATFSLIKRDNNLKNTYITPLQIPIIWKSVNYRTASVKRFLSGPPVYQVDAEYYSAPTSGGPTFRWNVDVPPVSISGCAVVAGQGPLIIPMRKTSIDDVKANRADWQSFSIRLNDCSIKYAYITVTGQDGHENNNLALKLNPQSTAQGLGIMISDINERIIFLGTQDKLAPISSNGEITLKARYFPLGQTITAGTANASATITIAFP